jgi:hypothetical protein
MAEGGQNVYVHKLTLKAADKKLEKALKSAVQKAAEKAVKKGKGLVWKKPSGQQTGFAIEATVSVDRTEKGGKLLLEATVQAEVRTVPSQMKVLLLAPSKEKGLVAKPAKPEKEPQLVEDFVYTTAYKVLEKKVVPELAKKATELGSTQTPKS